jgi:hypothetical protein
MSILALTSDTLIATAAAGNIEYNGQFFATDSAASRAQMQRITQGTAVASTSGTSIDFTGLPAWVKRITVMFSGVSTSGTSFPQIQIGSGSVTTTGYLGSGGLGPTFGVATSTTGFSLTNSWSAAVVIHGKAEICLLSGNVYVFSFVAGRSDSGSLLWGGGSSPALGGALDRVRITTVNGTDTFDAGTINILYEG